MTGRLEKEEAYIITPGRLGTHGLRQVLAYPQAEGPIGVKLVPGVNKGICEHLGLNTYVKPPITLQKNQIG